MNWKGVARFVAGHGWRRGDDTGKLKLAEAYRAFKDGRASKEHAQIIVADLAEASGFFKVNPPGLTADERSYQEGARSVFARMQAGLMLTGDEFIALQETARLEALATQGEGQI